MGQGGSLPDALDQCLGGAITSATDALVNPLTLQYDRSQMQRQSKLKRARGGWVSARSRRSRKA
jgi:hypothetical protein